MALNIPQTATKTQTETETSFLPNTETAKEVVTVAEPNVPAVRSAEPKGMAVSHRQDDDGFGASMDKDLGFGSFPIVKLNEGKLQTEDQEFDELKVKALRAQSKHLIKARAGQEDGIPFVYSYDGQVATDGRTVADHIREWMDDGDLERGHDPITSEYKEVVVEIQEGPLAGEIVILNVAPASKARLAGYNAKLRLKGKDITQVVTLVKAGPKIDKGKKSFRPWDFSEAV